MTRRRLRLPELIALLAVTTPVLAGQPDSPLSPASGTAPGTASVGDSARQLGVSVKRSSAELGQHVANGAREAGQKLSAGMQQAGQSLHRWWDGGAHGSDAQSPAGAAKNSLPQSASLQASPLQSSSMKSGSSQSTSSLGSPTGSAKSQGSSAATGQSWP
jgi:hypothetical protein